MKYIKNEFYIEVNNPKYIFSENKTLRETSPPKSLKTKSELMKGGELEK